MIRATFEPFTDRQKRTITEAFARPDIYDYLAKLAKKLHRTQKEIIYQARELGVSAEYEQAKSRYHKLHERLSRLGASNRSQYTFYHDSEKKQITVYFRSEYSGDLAAVFDEDPNLLELQKISRTQTDSRLNDLYLRLQEENKAE
jgi:allophanate hydrolase subunit 1